MGRRFHRNFESQRSRKQNTRERLNKIIIFCEGEKTEKLYFSNFKQSTRCEIKILETNAKDAESIVKEVVRKKDQYDSKDIIWCVFDVDNNTNQQLINAKTIANRHNVKISLSNPSFEIWFYLHYEYTTRYFLNNDLIHQLNHHITNYEKNKNFYHLLASYEEVAISNAQKLVEHQRNLGNEIFSRESNPVTLVHELLSNIYKFKR